MSIVSIISTLLVFTVIVVVHEFGHFIIAKKNGILVEEFAIGMGPKLFDRRKGDTLYSVRLFPIGGYCKMLGEENGSTDERSFAAKTVAQRIAVCLAGVVMNFLLAIMLAVIVLSFTSFATTTVSYIQEGSPAQAIGLEVGDVITRIDNKPIRTYEYIGYTLRNNGGQPVSIKYRRGSTNMESVITPATTKSEAGDISYKIGIMSVPKSGVFVGDTEFEKAGILETFMLGYGQSVFYVKIVADSLIDMVTFNVKLDDFAGPIGVGQIVDTNLQAAMEDKAGNGFGKSVIFLMQLATLLSANLAVLNLMPIPALDGGRIVFLIIEGIRRKPIDPDKEGVVHLIGFAIVIVLAVVVAFNDVMRLF